MAFAIVHATVKKITMMMATAKIRIRVNRIKFFKSITQKSALRTAKRSGLEMALVTYRVIVEMDNMTAETAGTLWSIKNDLLRRTLDMLMIKRKANDSLKS